MLEVANYEPSDLSEIMCGVVLCGGGGTRLEWLTRATNKHLLPVYNRPMAFKPIDMLHRMGIYDIAVVAGGDRYGDLGGVIGNGSSYPTEVKLPDGKRATFTYLIQEKVLRRVYGVEKEIFGGIAQALSLTEEFARGRNVAVILGDNCFHCSMKNGAQNFITLQHSVGGRIFLKKVPDPQRFGVATVKDGNVVCIVEKPKEPDSDLAVTGLYLFDRYVYDVIRKIQPSERGEQEITDVNLAYLNAGQLGYEIVEGFWTDAGTYDSLLRASILAAAEQHNMSIMEFVTHLMKDPITEESGRN
jgi:glucose-1-phosphate thymidylyltransferase